MIDCIERGLIPTEALNTHHCRLDQVDEKMPDWIGQQDTLIKAIVSV